MDQPTNSIGCRIEIIILRYKIFLEKSTAVSNEAAVDFRSLLLKELITILKMLF
jgi:hypothetical protein